MVALQTQFSERQPIHNHKLVSRYAVTERSIFYEMNVKTLLNYVYQALADHDMLCTHRVSEEAAEITGGKSYTIQIYGEDLNFRFEKQVMFANREDVSILIDILEKKVGKDRMQKAEYTINQYGPDDLNKAGIEMRKKWKEEWPL